MMAGAEAVEFASLGVTTGSLTDGSSAAGSVAAGSAGAAGGLIPSNSTSDTWIGTMHPPAHQQHRATRAAPLSRRRVRRVPVLSLMRSIRGLAFGAAMPQAIVVSAPCNRRLEDSRHADHNRCYRNAAHTGQSPNNRHTRPCGTDAPHRIQNPCGRRVGRSDNPYRRQAAGMAGRGGFVGGECPTPHSGNAGCAADKEFDSFRPPTR